MDVRTALLLLGKLQLWHLSVEMALIRFTYLVALVIAYYIVEETSWIHKTRTGSCFCSYSEINRLFLYCSF